MKPEWKDAPVWAEWLTYDADGWYWWETKPKKASDGQWSATGVTGEYTPAIARDLCPSIESRPTPEADGNGEQAA